MTAQPIASAGRIESLEKLLEITWRLRGDPKSPSPPPPEKENESEQPFIDALRKSIYHRRGRSLHLWFRGEPNADYSLAPSAFRSKPLGTEDRDIFYEETSATFHFMLRRPEYRTLFQSDFEWLTMLQHYGGLTRVLDWTENATVAAFFAVTDTTDADKTRAGSLYILNALQLNSYAALVQHAIPDRQNTRSTPDENHIGICIDTSPDVILRSAQAFCRCTYEWCSRLESVLRTGVRAELRWLRAALDLFDEAAEPGSPSNARQKILEQLLEKLSYPIAVFPHRSNARLVAQAGMFTLHGGKGPVEGRGCDAYDALPTIVPIEHFAARYPNEWLLRYEIPLHAKALIRDQLQAIGVHRSTLFPEVQSDGEIMKDLWCR